MSAASDLSGMFADAAERGLLHFSLSRMHSKERMWQASSRWTWSDGYRIAIEPDVGAAVAKALEQPAYMQTPQAVPAPVADLSVFD